MANLCDTRLKIYKVEAEVSSDELCEWLKDNYFCEYGDSMGEIEDEDYMEVTGMTKWNVITELLQAFCKKFGVKLVAIGIEDGNCFVQVAKVDENGELLSDECLATNL